MGGFGVLGLGLVQKAFEVFFLSQPCKHVENREAYIVGY